MDEALLTPCFARGSYSADKLMIGEMEDRLNAVEDALAICANQIELIRATQ